MRIEVETGDSGVKILILNTGSLEPDFEVHHGIGEQNVKHVIKTIHGGLASHGVVKDRHPFQYQWCLWIPASRSGQPAPL